MDDDWEFPAPKEDPEARPAASVRKGDGCPHLVPDRNLVEGGMDEEEGEADPGTPLPEREG